MSKSESGISQRNLEITASSLIFFLYFIRGRNKAFSHDVTAAVLVFQNNKTARKFVTFRFVSAIQRSETGVYFEISRDHLDFFWPQ